MSLSLLASASADDASAVTALPPPIGRSGSSRDRRARHTTVSLAAQLNREWAQLVACPGAAAALARWGQAHPALAGPQTLDEVLALIGDAEGAARDAVLLTLIELAQAGDALAGRTVLQTMLGKAVRVARTVARRDDVRGDQQEALARAVAALWQAIATYPVALRPARVAANLALDTVAGAQRGHTGSSHLRRTCPELPVADVRSVLPTGQHDWGSPTGRYDGAPDDVCGPADAELLTVLTWAVRRGAEPGRGVAGRQRELQRAGSEGQRCPSSPCCTGSVDV